MQHRITQRHISLAWDAHTTALAAQEERVQHGPGDGTGYASVGLQDARWLALACFSGTVDTLLTVPPAMRNAGCEAEHQRPYYWMTMPIPENTARLAATAVMATVCLQVSQWLRGRTRIDRMGEYE